MKNKKELIENIKIPVIAVIVALIVGAIIIAVTGSNPFIAYKALLQGCGFLPKKSYGATSNMFTDLLSFVNYFVPMIFAALSVAVALKAGLFNIGVSGQMLAAGLTATIFIGYSDLNSVIAKPLVIIIGSVVGMLAGALVGFLKYRFNINEVVSTIMFNYIFQYVGSFLINTYFVDPVTRQSILINPSARLSLKDAEIGGLKMDISFGFFLAIIAVFVVKFIIDKTILGYEIKAVGLSRNAAKYAGINVGKTMVISMSISGLLAGLAGVTYYMGYLGSIQPKVLVSTGYDAIAVSLLGNNNPIGIVFSTILVSVISNGSAYMKSQAGVEAEIASVITGIILLFSASNAYIKHRANIRKINKELHTEEEGK